MPLFPALGDRRHLPKISHAKNRLAAVAEVETLEDRCMMAPLADFNLDFPKITYDAGEAFYYSYSYDATTGQLDIDAYAQFLQATEDDVIQPSIINTVAPDPNFTISILVSQDGTLVSGVAGDDLKIVGSVTVNGTLYSGTLLTGEITEFGFENVGPGIDVFYFRFTTTGGSLTTGATPIFSLSKDITVANILESFQGVPAFAGVFTTDFGGRAKGSVGTDDPLPCETLSKISGYVYIDANNNGCKDAKEIPIEGVLISLKDKAGNVLATTYTDENGYYEFKDLVAGTYFIHEQQPLMFVDGKDKAGKDANGDKKAKSTVHKNDVIKVCIPECKVVCSQNNNFGERCLVAPSKRTSLYSNTQLRTAANVLDVNCDGILTEKDVTIIANGLIAAKVLPKKTVVNVDPTGPLTSQEVIKMIYDMKYAPTVTSTVAAAVVTQTTSTNAKTTSTSNKSTTVAPVVVTPAKAAPVTTVVAKLAAIVKRR